MYYVWSHISTINNSSGLGPYQGFVSLHLSSHCVLCCQELVNTMLAALKYVLGGVNRIKSIALKTSGFFSVALRPKAGHGLLILEVF